jgi:hypothetical protein
MPQPPITTAFELHDAEQIRAAFENGLSPNADFNGKPLVYALIQMYTRGPRFKACMQAFVDHGLQFDDPVLLAVLLDDASGLDVLLAARPDALTRTYTFEAAFTPLLEVSLLHICAEYNHVACAEVLVRHGADVNARAGLDENGFGGQTPIFHTVNQDANKSMDMLRFLFSVNADPGLTVKGLIWGKGHDWETFIPDVTPLSYAMMGLLRQFQRTEQDIYAVVSLLLKAKYGLDYQPANVPNRYLLG